MPAIPSFPGTLPRPQLAGYGYDVRRPQVTTAADRGCGRIRRVGLANTVAATLHFVFTDAQLATWAQFWRTDLAGGSLPFTIKLLNAYDDRVLTAQPTGPFTQAANQGQWSVDVPIELIDQLPMMSVSDLSTLISDPSIPTNFNLFHLLVHVTLPEQLT